MPIRKPLRVAIASLACAASGLVFATPLSASASTGRLTPAATGARYTFVFDNNYLGNDYRPQLSRLANLTAQLPPFKGLVTFKEVESQNTVAAQIADVNDIISSHPNVLLLEPASPSALAPVVNRACAAGIIVVDVDQAANSSCAWSVAENFYNAQYVIGEWMAAQLNKTGTVFLDQGLPVPNISERDLGGFPGGTEGGKQRRGDCCRHIRRRLRQRPVRTGHCQYPPGAQERVWDNEPGLLPACLHCTIACRFEGGAGHLLWLQRQHRNLRPGRPRVCHRNWIAHEHSSGYDAGIGNSREGHL